MFFLNIKLYNNINSLIILDNLNEICRWIENVLCNFRYAYILNDKFSKIIPSEFLTIIVVMCYNLIHMAFRTSNTVSCIQDVMVIASTLAPIFYYCWFGNEIKLKVILVTSILI